MWESFLGVHKPAVYRVGECGKTRFWVSMAPWFQESANVGKFSVYGPIYVYMYLWFPALGTS